MIAVKIDESRNVECWSVQVARRSIKESSKRVNEENTEAQHLKLKVLSCCR